MGTVTINITPHGLALFSTMIAAASVVLSILALRASRRATEANVRQGLIRQAVEINETFARYGVPGPYAQRLKVQDPVKFSVKGTVFLNQLNLLHAVYVNRRILGHATERAYLDWALTFVKPWIEGDGELMEAWALTKNTHDLFGHEFIDWLSSSLPIVKGGGR